jgi:hypothetical protein
MIINNLVKQGKARRSKGIADLATGNYFEKFT